MPSPSRSPFPDDVPRWGDVVAGKYRVTRTLGRGGMAVVVAAEHVELRQEVALKFLHREMAARPELVRRFLREGQAAARLRSEHAARVIDVARTDDGQPFLVMELLEGIDLGQKLRQDGPLPVADAALYVIQTCAAIGEAHGLGIVHRDLKPANLFLTHRPDGTPIVKVVDFGISKILDADGALGEVTLTTGADVLGSPLYMAPEQIRTPHDVDGRADLWSLGAILHRLVSNRHAFGAETPAAVLANIISGPPVPLRTHAPHAPPALEAIVARCLTADLDARWQTAADLADALRPFAPGGQAVHVPLEVAAAAQAEVSTPGGQSDSIGGGSVGGGTMGGGSVSSVDFAPGRRRLVSSVVIGTAIALVAVGVAAMVQMGGAEDAAPAASPPPAATVVEPPARAGAEPPSVPPPDVAPPSASSAAHPTTPPPSAAAVPSIAPPAAPSSASPTPMGGARRLPGGAPDPLDDRL